MTIKQQGGIFGRNPTFNDVETNDLTTSGSVNLDGPVTINGSGADADFRVEGDTDANLIWVDASRDKVGIGHNWGFDKNSKLRVEGPYLSSLSTSSVSAFSASGGGAVSTWIGGVAYSYGYIQAIQDDGTNNLKAFYINPLGGGVSLGAGSSPVTPNSDGTQSLGASGARWSVVYATTGTINTSDEREKTFLDIEDAERTAALEIKANLRKFKFNHAIESKGDDARIHFGASAQQVGEILVSHGLNPDAYGFYCYDEWEADEDMPAGNRYGIRYDELLAFILAAL